MNMKLKSILIVSIVLLLGVQLSATQTAVFFRNGTTVTDTIMDASSRTGMIDFARSGRKHASQVWMINFENNEWNFPNERNQLNGQLESIFLRDGRVIYRSIVDFSSRRYVYEFANGEKVHERNIKRIYFRGPALPPAYQQLLNQAPRNNAGGGGYQGNGYASVFLLNGKKIENPLSYFNDTKTGFSDGLQINSKDIWMINLDNGDWNFPTERQRLRTQSDTIFLKNGQVVYANLIDYNGQSGSYSFKEVQPIHESQIKRIYLCCYVLPNAYQGAIRKGGVYNRRQ
jgi:hypothetical protein